MKKGDGATYARTERVGDALSPWACSPPASHTMIMWQRFWSFAICSKWGRVDNRNGSRKKEAGTGRPGGEFFYTV